MLRAVHAAALHAARAAGGIFLPFLRVVFKEDFQLAHGGLHAGNDDLPVNGEGGKQSADLLRRGFRFPHLRFHARSSAWRALERRAFPGKSRL